jgi:hypothetical protein
LTVPATVASMIVGLLTVRRKEAPAMAGADRMTIEEVVKKVLLDEHADVIHEAAMADAGEMMEIDVVRHEALLDRAGCETSPPGCRSSLVKLGAV